MNLPFPIKHIGIYGVGLLGGSLGKAVKHLYPSCKITGIGRSKEKLDKAVELHAIDERCCNPPFLPQDQLDLLVLCTPVNLIATHLRETIHAVKPNGFITDVGSTKSLLVQACENATPHNKYFIGSHPMAGSHESGIEAARHDLFTGKVCIVTPTKNSHEDAARQIISFWQGLGMRPLSLPPNVHDQLTARSSHLPHLMAAALCKVAEQQDGELVNIIGDGFRDTTRIAAGDPNIWLNICLENRLELVQSLEEMKQVVGNLQTWIQNEDHDSLETFLRQTQAWKLQSEKNSQ